MPSAVAHATVTVTGCVAAPLRRTANCSIAPAASVTCASSTASSGCATPMTAVPTCSRFTARPPVPRIVPPLSARLSGVTSTKVCRASDGPSVQAKTSVGVPEPRA